MKEVIEKLENRIQSTPALTILDKRDDGFTYSIALQKDGETHVVFTTKGIFRVQRNCLVYLKVSRHIPFDSVSPTTNGDFIQPYTLAIRDQKTAINGHLYGLTVDELPIFQ